MATKTCITCGQQYTYSLMNERVTPPYCRSCLAKASAAAEAVSSDKINPATTEELAGQQATTQTTPPSADPEVLILLKRIAAKQADTAHVVQAIALTIFASVWGAIFVAVASLATDVADFALMIGGVGTLILLGFAVAAFIKGTSD